jgi:hypothetical protein
MATSLKDKRYNSILIEGLIPLDNSDCTSLWRSLGLEGRMVVGMALEGHWRRISSRRRDILRSRGDSPHQNLAEKVVRYFSRPERSIR